MSQREITNDELHEAWDAGEVQWHRLVPDGLSAQYKFSEAHAAAGRELMALTDEVALRAEEIFERHGLKDWYVMLKLISLRG